MIFIKKPNISEAPWNILLSALFLSMIGLVALNSISYQSQTLVNPFFKQLFFSCAIKLSFFSIGQISSCHHQDERTDQRQYQDLRTHLRGTFYLEKRFKYEHNVGRREVSFVVWYRRGNGQ